MALDDPLVYLSHAGLEKVRQLDPFYTLAYQGQRSIFIKAPVLLQELIPACEEIFQGKNPESNLKTMAEGCEKIALHDFALYAFWTYLTLSRKFDDESAKFIKRNLTALGQQEFGNLMFDEILHRSNEINKKEN